MVISLGAELRLAVEANVTEVTFEFPRLLAEQNLLGCGCELKPSSKLHLVAVSCEDTAHNVARVSQITFFVSFLFVRGGKNPNKQALKRKKHSSSSDEARKYLTKIEVGMSWLR